MAVTTMSNPKPFICQDCKKTFVSLDKLNHHQHKFHGVPSKLTLSINRPSVPTSSSENIPDITPTPSTLLQDGEFTGVLEDVHKDTDTPTMRKLLQEYQITPSVFDKDFRDSFAKAAGKSSPGSASQNPRSRNPSRTPTVSRQNSQTQTIEGSSAKREEPFPMVPFSPFSFLINHLNSFGQMNSGVAVPTSIPSTVMTIPATTMAYPSFITNNSLLQGGLLLGQAMQSSSDRDKLHTQLSQLWAAASSNVESIQRDSATLKSEAPANGKLKRKFDDLASETSDSFSRASSERSVTPARRTKSILPTDDPILADKRHRNRLAADKCRLKRKEKQMTLERENEELQEKIKGMTQRYDELSRVSQEAIQGLLTDNATLKAENQHLRAQLGMGVMPVSVAGATSSSNSVGGLSLILQSAPSSTAP